MREKAVEIVRNGSRFLVTCHRRPDADALGSALGFAAVLRHLGKEAVVYMSEPLPDTVRFLMGSEGVVRDLGRARFDATFVMDTAAAELLPDAFPEPDVSGPVVLFDHHVAHDDFGDLVVRDLDAVATGEVVIGVAEALGVELLPKEAAAPLYAALVADTGGFRYPGTRPSTLRLGARLIEAGADPWATAYHLFEDWTWPRMLLLEAVIETIEMELGGKLATMRVSRAMLERVGANDDLVEGLVNYGRMVRGVEVAALVWEQATKPGEGPRTKVSLRSRGPVDVSRIAVTLGGGGHRAAAGATVNADLDATLAHIRQQTARLLEL